MDKAEVELEIKQEQVLMGLQILEVEEVVHKIHQTTQDLVELVLLY